MRLSLWGLLIGAAVWGCARASHHWGPWHSHWRGHSCRQACRHDRVGDGVEAWLDRTRRRLDITSEQKPAWDRFADAVHGAASTVCSPGPRDDAATGAPAAMDRLAGLTRAVDEGLSAVRPAFDALYAELTASQRRIIDRMMGGTRWI